MSGEAIAAVSGGAAILSGLIVAASNYALRRLEVASRENDELRAALVSFLHVLDLLGIEAQRQPKSSRTVRAINRFVEARMPQIDYTTGRLHERIFTPHFPSLMDRFSHASNRLLIVAPLSLLPSIEDVAETLADYESPDPQWMRRFEAARKQLVRAAREAVGADVVEPIIESNPASESP